jgi:DNA-binding response OmpR family regulator
VLLDVSMPGEDGVSIARRLRATGDVGIVMLSAAGSLVDRVVGLEVGADDYIAKPVDLRELLARLRAVLRRRGAIAEAPAAPTPTPTPTPAPAPMPAPTSAIASAPGAQPGRRLQLGSSLLDLDARRLTGPTGQEIPLGAAEFNLLSVMAARPRRVLSRDALRSLTAAEEADDRAIDVRIARLRRKLEAVPDQPRLIRTVRGEGYLLDPDG